MKMFEIIDQIPPTRMSMLVYNELRSHEVDTLDEYSPEEKNELVDDLNRAVQKGKLFVVPLSQISKKYLIYQSLPNLIDIALDNMDGRLKNSLVAFQKRLMSSVSVTESVYTQRGREYNHVEDLVFFEGSQGAMNAANILEEIGQSGAAPLTIKFDGKPTIYYGRETDGTFVLVNKNAWGREKITDKHRLYDFITSTGKNESWRLGFAEEVSGVWEYMEQSVRPDFRGYLYGDLLWSPKNPTYDTTGGIQFSPNKVTYRISTDTELGQRANAAAVGIALHSFFTEWGASEGNPVENSHEFNTNDVVAIGQTSIQHTPTVDATQVNEIRQFVGQHGDALDQLLQPREDLKDVQSVIYRFVNQTMKNKNPSDLSDAGFKSWLPTSNFPATKILAARDMDFTVLFELFNRVMKLKNDIIQQLDNADTDITATTDNQPGGEGYISYKHKVKLIARWRWLPIFEDRK